MASTDLSSSSEYSFRLKDSLIGAQMLFVAFGALVLVPLLTGLDPNVALFTAGAGTLLFQVITKRKVPIFLASSFAFIAPIIYGVQTWGIPSTMCGLAAAGLFYVVMSLLIKWRGVDVIVKILPPVVTGPVIMVIGLILAPVAVNMAMGKTGDGGRSGSRKNCSYYFHDIPWNHNHGVSSGKGNIKAYTDFMRNNGGLYPFTATRAGRLFKSCQCSLAGCSRFCFSQVESPGGDFYSAGCHCPGH